MYLRREAPFRAQVYRNELIFLNKENDFVNDPTPIVAKKVFLEGSRVNRKPSFSGDISTLALIILLRILGMSVGT
jgi:hypothetical protein